MTRINRRGVLAAIAAGVAGETAVRTAAQTAARTVDGAVDVAQYTVEQGDQCLPITPLSAEETVEEFYDYRTPYTSPSGEYYSSYGTTDLQRPETSICFLYDGPEGLSLVVVHDRLNDGSSGGAVTFKLAGLSDGAWVVGDDDYDAPSNYDTFAETTDGWQVDWTWTEGRSDGGAFRPLGEDFAVTIDPAFNEAAALYGDPYEGEITDWQLLSGDRSDPERISLALDQPITIRAGRCGGTGTPTTTTQETTTEEDETTTEEEQSSEPIRPAVEILPGKVNPRSHGRLPVVVHSTDEFDATNLARGSVEFGPGDAGPVKRIWTDADGDGRTDLKLHFWMDATDIGWDTDRVRLTGQTGDGRSVVGVTDIELVPAGDDEEDKGEDKQEAENEDQSKEEEDEDESEYEEEDEDESEDEEEDDDNEDEDDDDESEGRGRGNGRNRERGKGDQGNGRGNGGKGNGRGNSGKGNGRGNSGKGNGRGNGRGGGN